MVDDLDAVADRHEHGLCASTVRGTRKPGRTCDFHGRPASASVMGVSLRWIRLDVPRSPDRFELEKVDTLTGEGAAHPADLVGAVGDPGRRGRLMVRQVGEVGVAESAGDGDFWTIGEEARPGKAAPPRSRA